MGYEHKFTLCVSISPSLNLITSGTRRGIGHLRDKAAAQVWYTANKMCLLTLVPSIELHLTYIIRASQQTIKGGMEANYCLLSIQGSKLQMERSSLNQNQTTSSIKALGEH